MSNVKETLEDAIEKIESAKVYIEDAINGIQDDKLIWHEECEKEFKEKSIQLSLKNWRVGYDKAMSHFKEEKSQVFKMRLGSKSVSYDLYIYPVRKIYLIIDMEMCGRDKNRIHAIGLDPSNPTSNDFFMYDEYIAQTLMARECTVKFKFDGEDDMRIVTKESGYEMIKFLDKCYTNGRWIRYE